MTARNYDWILTVNNAINFQSSNTVFGVSSNFEGVIANVNVIDNTIKIKTSNTVVEPIVGELITSNAITTTGGSANVNVIPFDAASPSNQILTAQANIDAIARSSFIAEKNAFTQAPIVRLYTLYYPGEWYPPNANGNPSLEGAGNSWPVNFPFKFAEIRGDIISDLQYRVLYNNEEFIPYPISSSGISLESSGRVNEITLTVSNFDNLISGFIEDAFMVGNNKSNAESAIVNNETVGNIDPRTIPDNVLFDQAIVDQRGSTNVAFDFDSTAEVNGIWSQTKVDTRDLLGGVVEIKTTFATFLDIWPEYSTMKRVFNNGIQMVNSMPYRANDVIKGNIATGNATVLAVKGEFLITNNTEFNISLTAGEKIFIENADADADSFVKDVFKIDALGSLNETVAQFSLTSWLQFFKLQLPKRRFLKNNCPWLYKGEECQYPTDGTGLIPGTTKNANGFFSINNAEVFTVDEDVCAHDLTACELRNNGKHFGGYPGTGRTIPR